MSNKKYDYLNSNVLPKHLFEAVKLLGTKEIAGAKSNKEILQWAKECGLDKIYTNDDTAWCGLFIAVTMLRSNQKPLQKYKALRAKEWAMYGLYVDKEEAKLGDILVFIRDGGGHVGYYVGEDKLAYHVLGGNQSNMVSIVRILKDRCIAVRRVVYFDSKCTINKIYLDDNGKVSENES